MRLFKRFWWVVPIAIIGMVLAFVLWAYQASPPMEEALAALESDEIVTVVQGDWLRFEPVNDAKSTGLVIYPGGLVDARAYAPIAHSIASEGYTTIITPMPLNLAFIAANRASAVVDAYPEIEHWVIGGHSLGGAMAARFADNNADWLDGLVLWAAYPADGDDLSDDLLAVMSIYGEFDGLATVNEIEESRVRLPEDAVFIEVEGGNHAQFGWYGEQNGDGIATISYADQQAQIIAATLMLLEDIAAD